MAEKNPYVNKLTLKQIEEAEANHYYIQIGEETVEYQGRQTFSKQRAEYLFDELMESLFHMVKHGTAEDRRIAKAGLLYFHIHKLRIH